MTLPLHMSRAAKSEVELVVDRWLTEEGRESIVECVRMSADPDVCSRELATLFIDLRKYWEERRGETQEV